MAKAGITSEDIRIALRGKFGDSRQYAVAEEVGLTTGFSHRRIDMVVVDCFESNHFMIEGIEIKVSKQDLRHELQNPEKHAAFFEHIDCFTLACPKEVIDGMMDVIPKKWGLLIVSEDGYAKYRRKPLALRDDITEKSPISRSFVASLIRSIQKREPSKAEIREAYERGRKDEKKAYEYKADYFENEENMRLVKEYLELRRRLSLYGDLEKTMKEFEAFRALDASGLKIYVKHAMKSLSEVKKVLEEIEDG